MSLPFLLEIGTEEIPDWMIFPLALDSLFEAVAPIPGLNKFELTATPRRLVLWVDDVPERQPNVQQTVPGPAKSAPENAVLGFAKKLGVRPEDLSIQSTPKGDYYTYLRSVEGRRTIDILAEALPEIILRIPFPKRMYWTSKNGPRFIRPIRWIVALLGDEVVPFEIAGVKAGRITSGHRVLGAPQISVTIADYKQRLLDNRVIVGWQHRRKKIEDDIKGLGVRVKDYRLLEPLVFLTEYPTAIQGSFDREFLKLPKEVLSTVMRHHQRYFSVEDENGNLAPKFVAVINTDGDPEGLIRRGNERVLRARFADAKFFWETDLKRNLTDRVADLAHVAFQAKLGSYQEKTGRVKDLVQQLGGDNDTVRAAELSKTDLTTELVKEFTELQGVVGGLYAREQREPEKVWTAIYDHYKPVSMEDSIPRNRAGQLLSIADKLDTLRGCFGIGLIPTGSKDPFALRRAAQGIVKILVEGKLRLPIWQLLNADARLEDFVLDRIRYFFKEIRGFKYDEVNAVLASGWNDLVDVEERLFAVQAVRPTEDFEPLAASFKRIRNILRQAQFKSGDWVTEMTFSLPAEQELYHGFGVVQAQVDAYRQKKDYRSALETIAKLRPSVDKFFDQVLVNDPDAKKRQLRLKLLQLALDKFSTIADFSEIVTNG